MDRAYILQFASASSATAIPSHLGSGTASNVIVFDPNAEINDIRSSQNSIKRRKNSPGPALFDRKGDLDGANNGSTTSNKGKTSSFNTGKIILDRRRQEQRQFIDKEITEIIFNGSTTVLRIELYNMIEQLCLNGQSEELRIWEKSMAEVEKYVETVVVQTILDNFAKLFEKNQEIIEAKLNQGGQTVFSQTTNIASSSEDLEDVDKYDWEMASRDFVCTLSSLLKKISLLESILGPNPSFFRRNPSNLTNAALQLLTRKISEVRINLTAVSIIFKYLTKEAIDFFLANLEDIGIEETKRMESVDRAKLHTSNLGNSGCIVTYSYSGIREFDNVAFRETMKNELKDPLVLTPMPPTPTNPIIEEKLSLVREFLRLLLLISKGNTMADTTVENIELLLTSGFDKIQRALRKNLSTYVRKTICNIVKTFQLLSFVNIEHDKINTILRALVWRHLLQTFSEHIDASLPDLIQEVNWPTLNFLGAILEYADLNLAANSGRILEHSWSLYIQGQVLQTLQTLTMITDLLVLRNQFLSVADNAFQDDRFKFDADSAFGNALQPRDISAGVIQKLLKFCDSGMRQLSKNSGDETIIADALQIFKLIPDKETFVQSYAKDLSRRILTSRALNLKKESQFINGLLKIVGENDCTTRLEAMLEEYTKTKLQYQNVELGTGIDPEIDFSAIVLEKKNWAGVPQLKQELIVPSVLAPFLSAFENRYCNENEKKKLHRLDWTNYALHQLTLSVAFDIGEKELVLNLFQATVLLAFGDSDSLSTSSLAAITGLDKPFLTKVLYSLCTSKYPILSLFGETVTFNRAFQDKATRIRIPMIKERDVAIEETKQDITTSRTSEIQAAMVRELKVKRLVPFIVYLAKFLEMFSWAATSDLKMAIELLITQGYIKRSDDCADLLYIP